MTVAKSPAADTTATSTGHALAAAEWLDLHFQFCRGEYEAGVRAAGFQSGWRVLDAGCGGGGFLPLLVELVATGGSVDALDLAAEHVAALQTRAQSAALPVTVRQGSVTQLPYADGTFDGYWSANVSQYLVAGELRALLAEARRVLRPGGLLAVKEADTQLIHFRPAPPLLMAHLWEAIAGSDDPRAETVLRGLDLPAWLRRAGFAQVQTRTWLTERAAPLDEVAYAFCDQLLGWLAAYSARLPLAADEAAYWRRLASPDGRAEQLASMDFLYREGFVLATGFAPERDSAGG